MKTTLNALALFTSLALVACGNDDGMTNGGGGDAGTPSCTAIDPTFSELHAKIFNAATCNASACHGAPEQGMLLLGTTKDDAYASITGNTFQTESRAMYPQRVVAMDPSSSFLWIKLTDPMVPRGRMPIGTTLNQCELDAVETWINNGAMND